VLASSAPVTPLDKVDNSAAMKAAMAKAAGLPTPSSPGTRPARSGAGKRPKLRVAQGTKPMSKRVRQSGPPLSLEETLEILGAGELQMDSGRGVLMNDASRRDRKRDPKNQFALWTADLTPGGPPRRGSQRLSGAGAAQRLPNRPLEFGARLIHFGRVGATQALARGR